jgi:hypothetical protein
MVASAIDELAAGFDEPFARLGRDADDDRGAVVISWPAVPVELVRAAGFRPVVAHGSTRPTPAADGVLEPGLFPARLRQLVEAALTGRLGQVAAIVLPRTSDADYKCFLYLRELGRRGAPLPPVLLFDLLQSAVPEARDHNVARTRALFGQLAGIAGRTPDLAALRGEIGRADRARAAARRLDSLRSGRPRIAGVEAMRLLGARWQLDPERYAALAESAASAFAARAPIDGPRVLLAGAPVDTTALHAAAEAAGAVVVAELSPFGSGGIGDDVGARDEPVAALADRYRDATLDARTPVATLRRRIGDALAAVDAVIVSLPPDDQAFGWDYPGMREHFRRLGVPHAVVTGDPALAVTDADGNAIEALVARVAGRREARHG